MQKIIFILEKIPKYLKCPALRETQPAFIYSEHIFGYRIAFSWLIWTIWVIMNLGGGGGREGREEKEREREREREKTKGGGVTRLMWKMRKTLFPILWDFWKSTKGNFFPRPCRRVVWSDKMFYNFKFFKKLVLIFNWRFVNGLFWPLYKFPRENPESVRWNKKSVWAQNVQLYDQGWGC